MIPQIALSVTIWTLFAGLAFSQAPSPMSLDAAAVAALMTKSGWSMEDEKNDDGTIIGFGFLNDSVRGLALNFAKGGGTIDCACTWQLKDNYISVKTTECQKGEGRKNTTFRFYLSDPETLMLALPKNLTVKKPFQIADDDWFRFKRIAL